MRDLLRGLGCVAAVAGWALVVFLFVWFGLNVRGTAPSAEVRLILALLAAVAVVVSTVWRLIGSDEFRRAMEQRWREGWRP
jgi:hypothetical protein